MKVRKPMNDFARSPGLCLGYSFYKSTAEIETVREDRKAAFLYS